MNTQGHDNRPRQLVICCDGTNNTLTGGLRDTHVLRLFELLQEDGPPQERTRTLYYDAGVGAMDNLPATGAWQFLRRKLERIWSLAYGRGVYENIGEAYAFLMHNWRPGDQIWLFGFSRGAFTVRSVAGMVNLFGILNPEHEVMLPILLNVYFASGDPEPTKGIVRKAANTLLGTNETGTELSSRGDVAKQIRKNFTSSAGHDAWVYFVGVWDTVEAVGVPGLTAKIPVRATIHEKRIRHVRHALALDEQRAAFRPRHYLQNDFGNPKEAPQSQSLRQRWFWGAHGDSGGGYPLEGSCLPDRALRWMIEEANELGLRCELPEPTEAPDGTPAPDRAHDPVFTTAWWAVAGLSLRTLDPALLPEDRPTPPPEATSKSSVAAEHALDRTGPRLTPVLHDSVRVAPPRGKSPPTWIWSDTRRPLLPLIGSAIGVVGFAWLYGFFLAPAGTPLLAAWKVGATLADTQLQMVTAVFSSRWAELWQAAPQTHPGRAFMAELGLMASVAYLLGRGVSRAYARLAGRRTDRLHIPWWHWLGRALPLALAADFVENVGTAFALVAPDCILRFVLGVVGVASVTKWTGLAGCLLLLVLGLPLMRPTFRAIEKP